MKKVLQVLGTIVALFVLVVVGVLLWAGTKTGEVLAKTYEAHSVDVPVPWPLSADELAALQPPPQAEDEGAEASEELAEAAAAPEPVDIGAIQLERAQTRGKRLVQTRYVCVECHGVDLSGGVMIDAPPSAGSWART